MDMGKSERVAWEAAKAVARQFLPNWANVVSTLASEVMGEPLSGDLSADTGTAKQFWQGLRARQSGLYAVIGRPGMGKTALCVGICTALNRPTFVIGIKQKMLDRFTFPAIEMPFEDEGHVLESLKSLREMERPRVFLIDDAGLFFNNQSYRNVSSLFLQEMVGVRRHHNITIVVNGQQSSTIHKHLLDPDILFLKPPSLLFADNEREYIRGLERHALNRFAKIPSKDWVKWVYVVSDLPPFRGMMQYNCPPGWDEYVSKNKA